MATGGLTPRDREALQVLDSFMNRIRHAHGLVERFAADIGNPEPHALALRRLLGQMKLQLSGAGYDTLAQTCGSLEIAARRGAAHVTKSRILREGIGSLKQQIELEQRAIRANSKREAQSGPALDESGPAQAEAE